MSLPTLPTALTAGLLVSLCQPTLLALRGPDGLEADGSPAAVVQRLGGSLAAHGNLSTPEHSETGCDSGRVDGHAPIGVMGDHLHHEGEWMFSLRTMRMRMDGLRDSNDRVGSAAGFVVSPTDMDMNMLMLGGMYAPSDELTLAVMVPWISNRMDHVVNPTGVRFTTRSEGLGDLRVSGLLHLAETDTTRLHLNLGLSAPTGSITEKDDTPASAGADVQLPFPMQLGTGTWDLLPGITLNGQAGDNSWGAQAGARFHLGDNSQGYHRGNRFEASTWWSHRCSTSTSTSVRVAFADWDRTHGYDDDVPNTAPALFPKGLVPTADPDLQAGQRVDLLLGLNYLAPRESAWAGHRLAAELGAPIRQVLKGPALETDWIFTAGWQKAF